MKLCCVIPGNYRRKLSLRTLSLESEPDLVRRAQAGDSEAFSSLYRTHVQAVYRYLLLRVSDPPLAEDLTAEVFLRAVDALPRYAQRGLPFGAWLFRIAHDRWVDYYRQTVRRPTAELSESLMSELPSPSELAENSETTTALYRALNQLNDEQRDVIQFRFMEDWSLDQTARAMNKTVGAVKMLQQRALDTLRRLLQRADAGNLVD